jgi:hypothetical protein
MDKIYDAVPKSLSARQNRITDQETRMFEESKGKFYLFIDYFYLASGLPNSVVMDFEEDANHNLIKAISLKHNKLAWNVLPSDMEEKNSAGRGPIGDYVRTLWKGKEV